MKTDKINPLQEGYACISALVCHIRDNSEYYKGVDGVPDVLISACIMEVFHRTEKKEDYSRGIETIERLGLEVPETKSDVLDLLDNIEEYRSILMGFYEDDLEDPRR